MSGCLPASDVTTRGATGTRPDAGIATAPKGAAAPPRPLASFARLSGETCMSSLEARGLDTRGLDAVKSLAPRPGATIWGTGGTKASTEAALMAAAESASRALDVVILIVTSFLQIFSETRRRQKGFSQIRLFGHRFTKNAAFHALQNLSERDRARTVRRTSCLSAHNRGLVHVTALRSSSSYLGFCRFVCNTTVQSRLEVSLQKYSQRSVVFGPMCLTEQHR